MAPQGSGWKSSRIERGKEGKIVIDGGGLERLSLVRDPDDDYMWSNDIHAINFKRCQNVKTFPSHLMSGLAQMSGIDVKGLSSLHVIEDGFLEGCSGVSTLDLRPLRHLRSIGDDFLSGCSGLETLLLPPLMELKKIGQRFMLNCRAVKYLYMSDLPALECIGDDFLRGMENLVKVKMGHLKDGLCIGKRSFQQTYRLHSLEMEGDSLARIHLGKDFLKWSGLAHRVSLYREQLSGSTGYGRTYAHG